jgi:hypothetical protein
MLNVSSFQNANPLVMPIEFGSRSALLIQTVTLRFQEGVYIFHLDLSTKAPVRNRMARDIPTITLLILNDMETSSVLTS